MGIPQAAKRASKEADRLHKEVYGEPSEVADTTLEEPPVAEVTQEPASVSEEPAQEPAVATPEKPSAPEFADEAAKWEHKYKVLQGMYNAEIPRMHQTIKDLTGELDSFKQKLEAKETPVVAETRLLQDTEIEEFGPDLIDVVKRAAREEFLPEIERLKAENEQLKGEVGDVTTNIAENAREKVFNSLAREVPSWKELNTDPDFLTWLEQQDSYAGDSRRNLLQQAFANNDATRVVAFFKGYLNEAAATATPSTPAPAPQAVDAKVPIDSLVAPGAPTTIGNNPVTANQEGNTRIWTQAQIAAFYRDVQRGTFRGRDQEKLQIERDIVQAGNEGRIHG